MDAIPGACVKVKPGMAAAPAPQAKALPRAMRGQQWSLSPIPGRRRVGGSGAGLTVATHLRGKLTELRTAL